MATTVTAQTVAAPVNCNQLVEREQRCEQLLGQAVPLLNNMDLTIKQQQSELSDLDKQLDLDSSQLAKDQEQLHSWYRNPAIVAPIAAILGILAYSYASHK